MRTKFNTIFDLDHTLIIPKSGKVFPIDGDDWKFKPKVLEVLLAIYNNKGMISIYTNQAGVTFGHMRPIQIQELIVDVVDNIITFIVNETGYSYKTVSKRFDIVTVMGFNSQYRKGKRWNQRVKGVMIDHFNIKKYKDNIFFGDGSGINLILHTGHKLKSAEETTLRHKTELLINAKLVKLTDISYSIISSLKSDLIAAHELGCSQYFDMDLFINATHKVDHEALFYPLSESGSLELNEHCPNLLKDRTIDFDCDLITEVGIGEYSPVED